MQLKSTLRTAGVKIKSLPREYKIAIVAVVGAAILYGIIFFIEKPVTLSYAGETCIKQFTLFPTAHQLSENTAYKARPSQLLKVGNVTVAARSACFLPTQAPKEGTTKISIAPFGGWLMRKTFAVTVTPPPTARLAVFGKPIPASKPLTIPLSGTDKVHTYVMQAANKQVVCTSKYQAVACDVKKLGLLQGKAYTIKLTRQFNSKKIATMANKKITTLSAVSVVNSSVKPDETVYSRPKVIDIVFDKKITKIKPVLYRSEGDKRVPVTATTKVNDKSVQLVVAEELPRSTNYELTAATVEASDGSGLAEPYKLAFKTSGGPKVAGVNIGKNSVQMGATAVVTFDQPLSEKQDISKIVSVSGGAAVSGRKGTQLFINLASVPKCGDFSIKITKDLQSNYDIAGNSAWSYSSRMVCHTISTIGYSSKGRAINAYHFGSGPATVLYTGAIHGSEVSSKYLMEKWIGHLEANARSIPANKTVVVVPQINPDGVASGARVNARNVDLNRNFATSDWQKDTTTVTNAPFPGGGGESPMSEPETQAIASFVQRLRPALVLSYHSIGGLVAANQAGSSSSLAGTYSQLSGYRNTTGQSSTTFEYSISGTADDWYAEKLGVPSILIELSSHTNAQFERNQKAMWTMLGS